ncbi:CRISPR-associated protein [Aeropyrum pernix K1]|uniref:CRISPR-associated protein n=1 Tax=Aeropyrum pernix (strain ATCC 700893 / DSM 11879 / JCM 9820 / NBRC 100138 / K1) TaxID=272557 RepID=Q9YCM8_AERPE|nr:type I-A CRISPR-associated protein Cas8a2/Csa4 [Aeropyrum pernix]BAA80219.1 CRISPR-associated protein [Aeropyrum pernix K1]
MVCILYTPGHNLYTDTLILYGIARLLAWSGKVSGEVERVGERYVVKVDADNCHPVSQLPESIRLALRLLQEEQQQVFLGDEGTFYSDLYRLARGSKVGESILNNLRIRVAAKILSNDANILEKYVSPGHKKLQGEFRGRKKGLVTLVLPLGPLYGKFYTWSLKPRRLTEKPYVVCPYCYFLSVLGFHYGSYTYQKDGESKVVTLSPHHASLEDVLALSQSFEAASIWMPAILRYRNSLTGPGLSLYVLSLGETLLSSSSHFEVLYGEFSVDNNTFRVVDVGRLPGVLLTSIAIIKYHMASWPRLIDFIARRDPGLLHRIALTLSFEVGNEYALYGILREILSLLNDDKSQEARYLAKQLDRLAEGLAMVWESGG